MERVTTGQIRQLIERANAKEPEVDFDLFQKILKNFKLVRDLLAVDVSTLLFFLDNLAKVRELRVGTFERIVINFGLGLEGMKKAGEYDWVDPDINEQRVKLEGKGEVEEDVVLLDLGRDISTEDAEAEILAHGLEPSGIAAGFAYTAAHPELKDVTIVCLGSVVVRRFCSSYSPYFECLDGGFVVCLLFRSRPLPRKCRFLCSRKRSPA